MGLALSSPAFAPGGGIPALFTCEGQDLSPALEWTGIPEQAKSLVLIVDDPDAPDPRAPRMTWVHWVLYNIPPTLRGLEQGVSPSSLPAGVGQGSNDWKRTGYGGPCPPIGRHRYFHKLYALDTVLPDLGPATKPQVEEAMKGHVIGHAELVGTYEKQKP
jgi:Raf kinase inhibitor-like YbhB/YbcL family protein